MSHSTVDEHACVGRGLATRGADDFAGRGRRREAEPCRNAADHARRVMLVTHCKFFPTVQNHIAPAIKRRL
jgi:hypothetical protein